MTSHHPIQPTDPQPTEASGRVSGNERGMAMLTVLVFSFVFIVGIMAFFTVNAYEVKQAKQRENSTRAFFLADGAIERAKYELGRDITWKAGFAWTNYDGGKYKLKVTRDTTWNGIPAAHFYAEGVWDKNKRDVEVFAKILPPSDSLAIWAGGNIGTGGNVDLVGHAHANGTVDGSHFRNVGTFDDKYPVLPPAAYTEPDSFPGATYYYVTAQLNPTKQLFIKDRNGVTQATYTYPADPHGEIDWNIDGARKLTFDYMANGAGPHAFDYNVGPFAHVGSDKAVVINFGQGTINKHDLTDLSLKATGGASGVNEATYINARYIGGGSPSDRYVKTNWVGGELDVATGLTLEPRYCIALMVKSINKANAQTVIGTAAHPALTYVLGDIPGSCGQFTVRGSLLCLGNADFSGGTNLRFDKSFISCLPPTLKTNWPSGASGEMIIYEWREPAPKAIS